MKYYATILALCLIPLSIYGQPATTDVSPTDDYGNPTVPARNAPPKDSGENTGIVYVCTGGAAGDCTFADLIQAINKVVNFGITLALSFSVVVIAWAGGRIMISADNPGERTKAKQMFVKVAWGIFFMLAAFLIVKLITTALLTDAVLNNVPLEDLRK